MVPPGADDEASSSAEFTRYPEPPYSVELLADLHADVLAPDVAAHIRSRLVDDPHAQSVLDALDATARDLRGAAVAPVPVPPDVTERTHRTLDRLGAEVTAVGGGEVVAARRHHRARRWAAAGVAGAAAVAVVAAVSVIAPRAPEPGTPVQAQPSATADAGERVTLLSVLGNDGFAPFGSEAALRRCTAANGVAADAGIVGSGRVSLRDHDDAVAILLSTGVAGVFDALIVGSDCTTDNPSTISRTTVGN
ncbi:hypothetical protein [Gordonia tangerina]|uniref:Anti-sigma-M factor RsmA n=1 Tax=Gordonia tangerina TaxID=2911060 RepID=A0ABS9DCA9_9ACTN|nr:hypothetical protein [Gordonia tangerina]MCF3936833.1 hypothetical protein [Gordonia tangerina]